MCSAMFGKLPGTHGKFASTASVSWIAQENHDEETVPQRSS